MEQRQVIYCLVPPDQARTLVAPLRKHFAHDPRVQVIVDRRVRERRASRDTSQSPLAIERRAGTDRRRPVLPRSLTPLPKRLAEQAGRIRFVQRMLPLAADMAQADLDRIVERVRVGDPHAPTELYWRMYERVHSRLSVLLGDVAEADMHVVATFGRMLDALEQAEPPLPPLDRVLEAAVNEGLAGRRVEEKPKPKLDDRPSLAVTDPELDEPIHVQDRDPHWFGRAMSERDRFLRQADGQIVAIEHIGGTAVPATPGRPVIDLMMGVERMPPSPELVTMLLGIGYVDCGAAGTPGRRLFRRRTGGRFDIHVVEHGGDLWRDAIALREYLRRHPHAAHRWGAARREAARTTSWSYLAYAEARAEAFADLLQKVRADAENPQDAGTPSPAA